MAILKQIQLMCTFSGRSNLSYFRPWIYKTNIRHVQHMSRKNEYIHFHHKRHANNRLNFVPHPPRIISIRSNQSSAKVEPMILPDIGEGIVEVLIKDWHVKVGDVVKEFDGICDVESDKATATISSRFAGVVTKVHYETGDMAAVGKPLVDIETSRGGSSGSSVATNVEPPQTSEEHVTTPVALPSVRRLARQHGVDLARVKANGRAGRLVLMEDLRAHIAKSQGQTRSAETGEGAAGSAGARPDPIGGSHPAADTLWRSGKPESRVALRGIKKAMFKTMTNSLKIPHFAHSDEIDMSRLVDLVREHKALDVNRSAKVSQLAFIIKMVSMALLEHPELNASVDQEGSELTVKHYHNIGVAMDTAGGLIVPNIKSVENLTVLQITTELDRLRQLAYSSKLGVEDLSGATLSLSNIGSIGGVFGVPVLVSPEIVIGALGRIRRLPRFNSAGQVEARHMMQLVWSADHRCVDGAQLCRFNNLLKSWLERPELALARLS